MPCRARDLKRALEAFGLTVETPRGGGSHWRVTDGVRSYSVPLPNGVKTELSDVYVRGVCRAFGLDEKALRAKL